MLDIMGVKKKSEPLTNILLSFLSIIKACEKPSLGFGLFLKPGLGEEGAIRMEKRLVCK